VINRCDRQVDVLPGRLTRRRVDGFITPSSREWPMNDRKREQQAIAPDADAGISA
jgi:hypothetical protein